MSTACQMQIEVSAYLKREQLLFAFPVCRRQTSVITCTYSSNQLRLYRVRPNKICKRFSFECDMGKYSTRSMNKVWAFGRTPYSFDECCIFQYRTKYEQRLYFLTRKRHTWHNCNTLQLKLQLECDIGWYRHTFHRGNHCTECENSMYNVKSKTIAF